MILAETEQHPVCTARCSLGIMCSVDVRYDISLSLSPFASSNWLHHFHFSFSLTSFFLVSISFANVHDVGVFSFPSTAIILLVGVHFALAFAFFLSSSPWLRQSWPRSPYHCSVVCMCRHHQQHHHHHHHRECVGPCTITRQCTYVCLFQS